MQIGQFKLRWLLLGEFLGSFGNSFIWPLTTIYMHNQLHQSLTTAGIVLMLYSGANAVGSTLAGPLFDRYAPQRLLLGGIGGAVMVMAALVLWNGWPVYPILLTLFGFFNGWIITLINAYGTLVASRGSRVVFNRLYVTNNLGVVGGTMVAGPLYQFTGNQVAPMFAVTIVLYFAYALTVARFLTVSSHGSVDRAQPRFQPTPFPKSNRVMIITLFIAMALIWVTYTQWSSNLSVYLTGQGISMARYSFLWTINGLLILVFQPIINRITQHVKTPYNIVYLGALACGGSFLILLIAHSYWLFVLGMAVLTLGEATAFPTVPALINTLTPVHYKGQYQGLLNTYISVGKAVGPVVGGLIITATSYRWLFSFCAAMIGMVILMVALVRRHERGRYQDF